MKPKDTLLLNNTITHNPNLARRAWFLHVASHMCSGGARVILLVVTWCNSFSADRHGGLSFRLVR